jgi:prepilin-type N-terminal cleavage/methylation domain-containing protein
MIMMRNRQRRDERGFSLIELTVVLLVGSIVTFMMLNFLDGTSAIVSRSTSRVQAESDARNALRTALQDIRAAQSIATAYPTSTTCPSATTYPAGYANCLQFVVVHATSATNVTCPSSLITYGLVNQVLKEDRVDYNASCTPRTIFTGKTILKNVVNGTRPLFQYTDSFGNALNPSSSPASAFVDAGTVRLQLFVQYRAGAPELAMFSTAALRNNR